MALLELYRSFADLWNHFDSAEAFGFGRGYPLPSLQGFDEETCHQHAVAFRSLIGAVEDLELETLDEEIDRTVLLSALRTRVERLDVERPESWNPALWVNRLLQATVARPGSQATLAALPEWVASAMATLTKPSLFSLQVALGQLSEVRDLLRGDEWSADPDARSRALTAVEEMDRFLRHEIEPDPEPNAGALGADKVEWRLHHEHMLEVSSSEALRRLSRRVTQLAERSESVRAEPLAPIEPDPDAFEIRSRLIAPSWGEAWTLFVASLAVGGGASDALLTQARKGGLDYAIQMGQLGPIEGIARLGGDTTAYDDLVVFPLAAAATTLLVAEWEAVRARWTGNDASFIEAVTAHAVLHPILAAWRLDLTP
ncbi:MAG: hypothetical protein ACYC2K_04885 [Gemmatimonadales bacterium]